MQSFERNINTIFKRAEKDIIAAFNSKEKQGSKIDNRNMICLIDHTKAPFNTRYITTGAHGGQTAARKISSLIKDCDHFDDAPFTFEVYVFVNGAVLDEVSPSGASSFVTGFNQAENHLFMIDLGDNDQRISERLQGHLKRAADNHTWRIVLGGCDDAIYHPLLQDLVRSGMEDRLLLLRTSALSNPLKKLGLMTIRAPDGLFDAGSITASATVLSTVDGYSASSSPSAMPSPPTSPVPAFPTQTRLGRLSETWRKGRQSNGEMRLDPTLPPWKNSPKPCNMFYLLGDCKKGSKCPCSHDYVLDEQDKERMREAARKRPCDSIQLGISCTFGDKCFFGHECPYGQDCKFLPTNDCWFKGDENHGIEVLEESD